MDINKRLNILIAEDSDTMRMLLAITIMKIFPHAEITQAANGAEALKEFRNGEYDLVLTDMVMPLMGGAELIRQIRNALRKNTPIIIISTRGKEEDRDLGLSLGANAYITKPINPAVLRKKITEL